MAERKKNGKISDALMKVALGYQVAEVTEEYAEVDGELKLTKRKKTKKDVPPDLKAVQILLSENGTENIGALSDEELEREKKRLLDILANAAKTDAEKGGKLVEKAVTKATVKKTATKKSATKKTVKKKTAAVSAQKKGGTHGRERE